MAGTGNGATVALSVSTVSTCITSVELPNFAVEDLETSCLDTTNFKTFQASDLTDAGEITVNFLFNQDSDTLLARGVPEVITITWPIHTSGNTTNATFVADGYIREVQLPTLQNGELQEASFVFKLNGEDTEPAFTAEAA
jgi:hypothetical protein